MGFGSSRNTSSRHEREIRDLNDSMDQLRRSSQAKDSAREKEEENHRKFVDEILKRDKQREKENAKLKDHLLRLEKDSLRTKQEIRRLRKEKSDKAARELREEKERLQKLNNEKELAEMKEAKANKEKEELLLNVKYAKKKVDDYKTYLQKLINSNDSHGIDLFLNDIDDSKAIYLEATTKNIEGLETSTLKTVYNSILSVYMDLGDYFFSIEKYANSIKMYEKVKEFVYDDLDKEFYFKYGRTLFYNSQYLNAVSSLTEYRKRSNSSTLRKDLSFLLLKSYLKLEDKQNIELELNKTITSIQNDKSIIWDFLDIYYEYVEYSPTKENISIYLSYLLSYSHDYRKIKNILNVDMFSKIDDYNFFMGVYCFKTGKYKQALQLLEDGNDLYTLYYYKSVYMGELLEGITSSKILVLLKKFKNLFLGKAVSEREKFITDNKSLLVFNVETSLEFKKNYLELYMLNLMLLYKENKVKLLEDGIKKIGLEIEQYNLVVTDRCKYELAKYFNFYKKIDENSVSSLVLSILEKYMTKEELEIYLAEDHVLDFKIEDLYEIKDHKLDLIISPFYYALEGINKTNNSKVVILETYIENINRENIKKREIAIKKEQHLGEKYNNFAQINTYTVGVDNTRIVYNNLDKNFTNIIQSLGYFNGDTSDKKIKYINNIISIFKNLEEEKIVLSSLSPVKFNLDNNGNVILRDIFFDNTFRSESQSSIGSSRTSEQNRYKVPEDRSKRNYKSNYYLLGLIIYEVLYGEYIFHGVKDFSTIKQLHDNKLVDKIKVFSLRDKWILDSPAADTIRVEKIKYDKDTFIPKEYLDAVSSLLLDIDDRPKNLTNIENVFNKKMIIKERSKLDYKIKSDFKNYANEYVITEIIYKDEITKSNLADVLPSISTEVIDEQISGSAIVKGHNLEIHIHRIIKNKVYFETLFIGEKQEKDDLLQLITEKMTISDTKIEAFLFEIRQGIYELEDGKLLDKNYINCVNTFVGRSVLSDKASELEFKTVLANILKEIN